MRRAFGIVVLSALAIGSTGCSKLKSAAGGGDDGGGGGGIGLGGGKSLSQVLNGFEGEIGIRASGQSLKTQNNTPTDFTLDVKNDNIRADLPPGLTPDAKFQGHVIIRQGEKKLYFVQDAQKQAIVIDLNKAGEHLAKAKQGGGPFGHAQAAPPSHPPPKVTKTGKKDTVAGTTCENWDIENTETNEKLQVCVAEQGVSWFHIPFTGAPPDMAWAGELLDGQHFPLRAITYDKAGAEEGRIEVTRMDKKSLDDSLFEVPAGYKSVDLEQLFGGLGAAGAVQGLPKPPHSHHAKPR